MVSVFFFLFNHSSYRFTQIVVDAQIKTPGGKTYDVIFVGTGKWKINMLKAFTFFCFSDIFHLCASIAVYFPDK